LEDLFTEALARLFERRPDLCLGWLEETGTITSFGNDGPIRYVRASSQHALASLPHHNAPSRPDLLLTFHAAAAEVGEEVAPTIVMVESKVGSKEGPEQLRRYAEHLAEMRGFGTRTLLYVTRGHDPKDSEEVLSGLGDDVRFGQARWHDLYRFLQKARKDALVEEVMLFMEEQGMATSNRFSSTDLLLMSEVPRVFEIFGETLGGEVREELEAFAGNKVRRESVPMSDLRRIGRYATIAPLKGWDLFCIVGYELENPEGYPLTAVALEAQPGAEGREVSVNAMRRIAARDGWETVDLDDPAAWAGVWRERSLAEFLHEEDHFAAVRQFFVEAIRELKRELISFKEERPDLPWSGGQHD
jgi:hypothetical protein